MTDYLDEVFEHLDDKNDFEWYKKRLDADGKYDYDHIGEPTKYPCRVLSEYEDVDCRPLTYRHKFIYLNTVTCSECGHTKQVWPDDGEEYDEEK